MTKFAANNMRVGTSLFALTPSKNLYWLSTRSNKGTTITSDIKMGFITSIQEEGGAFFKVGDSCSSLAPELDLYTVKGFYWDDEWECYQIFIC